MSDPTTTLTGGCHCRSIRYSITLPTPAPADGIKTLCYCHCNTCRKLSGSAFLPFMEVPFSSFTLEKGGSVNVMRGHGPPPSSSRDPAGPMRPLRVSDKATRTFCTDCGSPVSMVYDSSPEVVGLCVGTLDDEGAEKVLTREVVQRKGQKICTGERVGWGDVRTIGGLGEMGGNPG